MGFIPFKIRLIDDKVWFLFSVGNILSRNKDIWVFWAENMKRPLYLFPLFLRVFSVFWKKLATRKTFKPLRGLKP